MQVRDWKGHYASVTFLIGEGQGSRRSRQCKQMLRLKQPGKLLLEQKD
jgi:hypothetical protein